MSPQTSVQYRIEYFQLNGANHSIIAINSVSVGQKNGYSQYTKSYNQMWLSGYFAGSLLYGFTHILSLHVDIHLFQHYLLKILFLSIELSCILSKIN